ncbi:DsbA family protein [Pseudaminobacter soli (ex Li et al. 2025)]|uniref:DsbA family protein n=1 Tax=Pseudaminobacter soli (ex Li et al. 2025) TaxID=1295366 RepID=UPI0011B296F3|nr:DsbA family protein [Mesorhizobium soli]
MVTPARLRKEEVEAVLAEAGLDPSDLFAAFKEDMVRIDGILARNMVQANAFGFGGAPAFIIETRIYHGAMDRQALQAAIATAREN